MRWQGRVDGAREFRFDRGESEKEGECHSDTCDANKRGTCAELNEGAAAAAAREIAWVLRCEWLVLFLVFSLQWWEKETLT